MDDVSTIRPAALLFKWGRAALMLNNIPLRLVPNMSSQALSLISSNFADGEMPAFAQRMSTPPNSVATVDMTSSMSPCSLTSPRQNIAVQPRSRKAATVAAPSGSFRPSTQTRAPSWAKTAAMPLPIPLVPPVTMTDLFRIDVSMESSLFVGITGPKRAGEARLRRVRVHDLVSRLIQVARLAFGENDTRRRRPKLGSADDQFGRRPNTW